MDSFVVSSECHWDARAYIADMEEIDIILTVKMFPATEEEYFEFFKTKKGRAFNTTLLSSRDIRCFNAKSDSMRYLFGDELKFKPDQEIAIAVEAMLPIANNPLTGEIEFFDKANGRWFTGKNACRLKGEDLIEPLRNVFKKIQLKLTDAGGEKKMMPMPVAFDDSCFTNSAWLTGITEQCRSLRGLSTHAPLNWNPRLRAFEDGFCLDFNVCTENVNIGDVGFEKCFYAPLRRLEMADRCSRSCGNPWRDYDNPRKWDLLALLLEAEIKHKEGELDENKSRRLSTDIKNKLNTKAQYHPSLLKIFFEAHNCWDETLYQIKMLVNPVNGKNHSHMEHYTMADDEEGSTGKGTARALVERSLGVHTGTKQRGYVSIIKHDALEEQAKGSGERPSEQWANMRGCTHVFADDFKADVSKPLSGARIRQISGGNSLSAARKCKEEEAFDFRGLLVIMTNGMWKIDGPLLGSDLRRCAPQQFLISFQNIPKGPMQKKKDANIKNNLVEAVPFF
jgi:hypothetical protein